MTRSKKLLALVPVLALVAAACGGDDSDSSDDTSASGDSVVTEESTADTATADTAAADTAAEEVDQTQSGDLTFHMITHSDDGPFWSVLKRGAEAAADAVGVELVWQGSNNAPDVQASDIEAAIAAGSDGIAASLPSPDQLIPVLQDAVAAGIPVYTINSGVNDYQDIGATTHVGQTEFIAGQGAGLRFNEAGATKILCGIQEQDNVALSERCDGVADTFEGEVVASFMDLDADQTAQEAAINAALSADPDIDAFQGVGPVITLSGLRAADALGRDLVIGGFDVTPDLLAAIQDGTILFTVDQQQYLQGYLPIVLMYLEVTNQNTAGGGLPILTGPGFIDQGNADAVVALVDAGTR
ncbi:MAG: substrate-binding domain-containing protein [Acidimicrobiia bacterium]|nr:substrate-binding domain-containing protein [Acidimicrobiia bacterium]